MVVFRAVQANIIQDFGNGEDGDVTISAGINNLAQGYVLIINLTIDELVRPPMDLEFC